MNRLEELLQTLCPDGVEYKRLGDVSSVVRGVTYSKSDEVSSTEGYKILRANNISLDTNTINFDDIRTISDSVKVNPDLKLRENDIFICTASGSKDHIGKVAYIYHDLDYYFGGFMAVIRTKPLMLSRFLFHLLIGFSFSSYLENTLNSSTINNLNSTILNGFRVPTPPLPVQKEIVRILDTFTALEAELEKQLEAELAARTKQYEHYRNELLSFDSNSKIVEKLLADICPDGVEYLELQHIFDFRNGYTPSTKNDKYWDNGSIPWFTMKDLRANGGILRESIEKITPDAIKGRLFESNSIIMSTSATIGEHALILVDALSNQRFTCLTRKEKFKGLLIPKFVYYYCFILGQWCRENINVSGFASVDMGRFSKFKFPIPPLEVQEKIVSILDRFDTLVNDLKSGLPAEIALRRKQYEYYRDKLLNFKPSE